MMIIEKPILKANMCEQVCCVRPHMLREMNVEEAGEVCKDRSR